MGSANPEIKKNSVGSAAVSVIGLECRRCFYWYMTAQVSTKRLVPETPRPQLHTASQTPGGGLETKWGHVPNQGGVTGFQVSVAASLEGNGTWVNLIF